jgi:competence protein ComEC
MHVLALSGLHIGIVFTLIYNILKIFSIFPKGRYFTDAAAILFIFLYSAATGFSPSVTRASIMIFIYRIACNTFRNTDKWDAIALSAMIIGIISPLQIFTIGFQLSYAAVGAIALLFPACKEAFSVVFPIGGSLKGLTRKGCEYIWNTLAISVCCQIATAPLVLYYFGNIPQYFLLANIIAVPLATIILYNLTLAILLHNIPIIGDWLISILNWFVVVLNCSMEYLSA